MMSVAVPPSLFFLQLPDLTSLLSVTLSLKTDEEPRTRQIQTCRELVLLFQDVLASPALDSFTDITALMTIPFFHKGTVQAFAHRRHLLLSPPEPVFPGDLQRCLSYSLVTRLAPGWNKAGLHLICGKDFLTERRRLNAVSLELSTSNHQLCMSVEVNSVCLPPTSLEDFDVPPLVQRRFCSDPDAVLVLQSTWCHVLPSMKKGQIISISRRLPAEGPFRTYRDLQRHWNMLYGYQLPELPEVYCSVYFKLLGKKLFTYPLSCIRLQPLQRCPQVDPRGALDRFLSDVGAGLQTVCGFPARLTSTARYGTLSLNPASSAQVSYGEQMNLTTSSSAIRPVTQLPPPLPPPPRPGQSLFGSQPPASTPVYQQGGALELSDKRFRGRLMQSQGCAKEGRPSSSSSSSSSSLPQHHAAASPASTSSIPLTKPTSSAFMFLLPHRTPLPLTFTSSPSPFQPASSLNSTSSLQLHRQASSVTTSSSPLPSPIPPPPPARPKLVPIFKNKHPSRHVNVALLRVQKEKEKEQMRNGGEENGRMTLPPLGRNTSVTSTSAASPFCSMATASLPFRPSPSIPCFVRGPKRPHHSPPPSDLPNIRRISSLSPVSKLKPSAIVTPKPVTKVKTKSILQTKWQTSCEKTRTKSSRETLEDTAGPSEPHVSSGPPNQDPPASSVKKVALEKKPKKPKPGVEDVENMARNNQLSRLSSSSLTAWLTLRGLPVPARLTKDELMLKVMGCLAEA